MLRKSILLFLFTIFIMIGCSPSNDSGNSQNSSYESTKKMVTDILKSDDGKKAIIEVIAEDSAQQLYVIHDDTVKKAIEEALTSDKGKEFWSKMFSDYEFVKEFAEAMMNQQEDVMTRLMGDSSYQEKMLELLGNPEFEQQIQELLKSQKFKGHLEESIQETLESPLFEATVAEIVIQHAKKIVGESGKEQGGGQSEQGGSGSGSGSGGGGGGGSDSGGGSE